MNIDELIEEYYDLEIYFKSIYAEHRDELKLARNLVEIPVSLINESIKIHETQLDKLISGEEPSRIPSFKYLESYGIKFKTYYELCISIQSDDYDWLEGMDWKTEPLKFKIDNTQFEIGPMSSLMVLLTEPVHSISDIHYDFVEFATVKMVITNGNNYEDEFSKGIFYLNSLYLKPIEFYASLKSLKFDDNDPLDLYNREDPEFIFDTSKGNEIQKDFHKYEPLKLYNFATSVHGEQRFLTYYRVLEFFMEQGLINRANELRFDQSISNEELIAELSVTKELEQLTTLMKTVLTRPEKTKLINYCLSKEIITVRRVDKIAHELYKYRNSIVHAKEKELESTNIPNPFVMNPNLNIWISVTDEFARKCIMKLNTK